MKYSVITFGCRVNQADSLGFEEELLRAAAPSAASPDDADLVIVNTCSVTASADQGARQTIRRIARDNPVGANRRHRLLRDAEPGGSRGAAQRRARRSQRRQAAADRCCDRSAEPSRECSRRARALRRRRRPVRRGDRARRRGRTAFTLRVQTGCAEPCSLLHHPDDARRAAQRAARRRRCARSSAWPRPGSRRSR